MPASAVAGKGGVTKRDNGGIDPTSVPLLDADLESVEKLAVAPSSDRLTEASLTVAEPVGTEAASLWPTGKGVLIAVIDGGFSLKHPAIAGRIASHGYDFVDGDADVEDLGNGIDDDGDGVVDAAVGHGTFVAGQILSVAPDATILPLRARNDEGLGSNQALVDAVEYAVAAGADVINLSVHPAEAKMKKVRSTLDKAWVNGILIVVAAGNEGLEYSLNELAYGESRIAVGAVDATRRIAAFSNYHLGATNTASMLFAPGVDLYGPLGTPTFDANGTWSGTSFAAAIVSGAAAVALERHPDMGPDSIRKLLLYYSVDPILTPAGEPIADLEGCINLEKVMAQ